MKDLKFHEGSLETKAGGADLDHYEVRYSPGGSYDSDVETLQASIAPDQPRELLTTKGLQAAGATALFRVYVVLKSGREAGSEVVSVSRPAAPEPTGLSASRTATANNGSTAAGMLSS